MGRSPHHPLNNLIVPCILRTEFTPTSKELQHEFAERRLIFASNAGYVDQPTEATRCPERHYETTLWYRTLLKAGAYVALLQVQPLLVEVANWPLKEKGRFPDFLASDKLGTPPIITYARSKAWRELGVDHRWPAHWLVFHVHVEETHFTIWPAIIAGDSKKRVNGDGYVCFNQLNIDPRKVLNVQ